MAKVVMPLGSASASGKLGPLVFGAWKGRNVVRSLVIPANPQTVDQGDQRLVMGGVGRAVGKIGRLSPFHNMLVSLGLIPTGQTKQSAVVKAIIDLYMPTAVAFEAMRTEFEAHSGKADFITSAGNLMLADFDVSYKGTTNAFSKGLMVYMLAKYAIDADFTGAPYTTALASWTATQTALLETALAAA